MKHIFTFVYLWYFGSRDKVLKPCNHCGWVPRQNCHSLRVVIKKHFVLQICPHFRVRNKNKTKKWHIHSYPLISPTFPGTLHHVTPNGVISIIQLFSLSYQCIGEGDAKFCWSVSVCLIARTVFSPGEKVWLFLPAMIWF